MWGGGQKGENREAEFSVRNRKLRLPQLLVHFHCPLLAVIPFECNKSGN